MKKIVAILLMGILFFNWYGYRLVSAWLEKRADLQLEARLDTDDYDPSQLITIKVPSSHLSYYNSSAQFERADGQIEISGVHYKYVARRLYNDSLELRCIPNQGAMRLQTARNEFFQLVNDIQQHNGQSKKTDSHSASKSPIAADYDITTVLSITVDLSYSDLSKAADLTPAVCASFHTISEQPPDHFTAC